LVIYGSIGVLLSLEVLPSPLSRPQKIQEFQEGIALILPIKYDSWSLLQARDNYSLYLIACINNDPLSFIIFEKQA